MVATRPATPADAPEMAALLNEIIAIGGTTAHEDPWSPEAMRDHYIAHPGLIACTVAELDGRLAGFQHLGWPRDKDDLPPGWAAIATFVRQGQAGRGIGAALFAATRAAAEAAGVATIDATIRADNAGGLGFYAARGFVDYAVLPAIPLKDGRPVDRVRKRYDLAGGHPPG